MNTLPLFIKNYLNGRCISDEILLKKNIWWNGSIVIPIDKDFNKYRRSPLSEEIPKYWYDKGATGTLYNIESLKYDTIVICEGELDVLCLESQGIHAVSSTGGAGTFLPHWVPLFEKKEVFICYDNDAAGFNGAVKAQSMVHHAKIIELPKENGVKDITEFFQKTDRAINKFVLLMAGARNYPLPIETDNDRKDLASYKEFLNGYVIEEKRKIMDNQWDIGFIEVLIAFCCKKMEKLEQNVSRSKIKNSLNGDGLKAAKEVPISNLIKFNSSGFANCIVHKEHTPSMKWYEKTGHVKCFACGFYGDVIDVYCKINSCSIKAAIEALNSQCPNPPSQN